MRKTRYVRVFHQAMDSSLAIMRISRHEWPFSVVTVPLPRCVAVRVVTGKPDPKKISVGLAHPQVTVRMNLAAHLTHESTRTS
jgi:hypothetical protein